MVVGKNALTMLLTPSLSRATGVTVADSVNVPAKEPVLARLIWVAIVLPLGTNRELGTALMAKSLEGTVTERVEPPVTETL